jgi:class 3 adenylate cyclase
MKSLSLFLFLGWLSWWQAPLVLAQSRSLAEIEAALQATNDQAEEVALLTEAAKVAFDAGDRNAYLGYGNRANKRAETLDNPSVRAETYYTLGDILLEENKHAAAVKYFERALKDLGPYYESHPSRQLARRLAMIHQRLGVCYEQLKKVSETEENFRRAAIYARNYARDPRLAAEAYNTLGDAYRRLKKYDKAIRAFKFSREQAEQAGWSQQVREAERKLETIEELVREQRERENAQGTVTVLMEDVIEKEEQLDIIQDSLDLVVEDRQLQISRREYLELQQTIAQAELEAQEKTLEAKEKTIEVAEVQTRAAEAERDQIIIGSVSIGAVGLLLLMGLMARSRARKRANQLLADEKKRSDELLLEILPVNIADELMRSPDNRVHPVRHEDVSILFTDFKGFSSISERMSEEELVGELETAFRAFDQIMEKYGMEKIKTIGDAYMAAAGLVKEDPFHALNAIAAGMEMQQFMARWGMHQRRTGKEPWKLRVGINSGSVVAGVVGSKKFAYDIWGKAVNLASRMESAGEAGKVNVSASTQELTKAYVRFGPRRSDYVKNIGEVDMYFVEEIIARRQDDAQARQRPVGGQRS